MSCTILSNTINFPKITDKISIFDDNNFSVLTFLIHSTAIQSSTRFGRVTPDKCERIPEQVCPACGSPHLIKNGSAHNSKSKYQCQSCGSQFVVNPTKITVSKEIKQLIDRLLLERISLRGIARVTQVSWSWLQDYVSQKLDQTSRQIKVSGKPPGKLTIECDEM